MTAFCCVPFCITESLIQVNSLSNCPNPNILAHLLSSSQAPAALSQLSEYVTQLAAGCRWCLCSLALCDLLMGFASISAQCTARGRTACVAHSKQHAGTHKATSAQPQSWCRPQQFRRPTPACHAEERSRDSTKTSEAERLKVPDMPPAKDSSRTSDVGYEIRHTQQAGIDVEAQFSTACRKIQVHLKQELVISQMSLGLCSKGKGSRVSQLHPQVTSR